MYQYDMWYCGGGGGVKLGEKYLPSDMIVNRDFRIGYIFGNTINKYYYSCIQTNFIRTII